MMAILVMLGQMHQSMVQMPQQLMLTCPIQPTIPHILAPHQANLVEMVKKAAAVAVAVVAAALLTGELRKAI